MPSAPKAPAPQPASHRIAAIDWLRGFVMVLMAVDHSSQMWNAGRLMTDSAYMPGLDLMGAMWTPGTELGEAQFYTRWITHLCAPTFLFLSGTSLAMSFEKRRARGMPERELDRHLAIRAGVVLGCELLLSAMAGMGVLMLQVLFAIGASMIAMIFLRRLPTTLLVAIGVGWLLGSEFVLMTFFPPPESFANGAAVGTYSIPTLLFFTAGYTESVAVSYPMTHWLAMMLLGWALGRFILSQPANEFGRQQIEKLVLLCGMSSLLLWSFVRSRNAYGNMGLLRDDTSVVQWLHMSKYPPALTYTLIELGIMALCLVICLRAERRIGHQPNKWNPLLVFGQTSLFFYMLHFMILGGAAMAVTGGMMLRGLTETWVAAGVTLVVIYPACTGFRALKRRHPKSFLQYI